MFINNWALLGYYVTSCCNYFLMIQDNFSVPFPNLRKGPIGCPETSVRNYHYPMCNNTEQDSSLLLCGGSL